MADTVTLRTRKFMRNALLARKQMVVYVFIALSWRVSAIMAIGHRMGIGKKKKEEGGGGGGDSTF